MQIGAIYPQNETGGNPLALDAIGRAAEELGYDHLLMFDHVAGAVRDGRKQPLMGPYSDKDPFHDPLVAFGYLAGVTKRIGFATGILILPQRQTLLVARQAADVDLLSGGRLRLGVATGWNYVEYEALGQDFHTRGKRLDEQIPLLRELWRGEPVDFEGRFDRVDRLALNPPPGRPIPLWCGGGSEPAYQRAARTADGFIFSGAYERIVEGWRRLQAILAEEDRPGQEFGAEYLVSVAVDPQGAADIVRRWQDEGGTHVGIRTMGHGFTEPEQHIAYLAEVKQRLG
jgi:probable F420-dependent oxidoreductase